MSLKSKTSGHLGKYEVAETLSSATFISNDYSRPQRRRVWVSLFYTQRKWTWVEGSSQILDNNIPHVLSKPQNVMPLATLSLICLHHLSFKVWHFSLLLSRWPLPKTGVPALGPLASSFIIHIYSPYSHLIHLSYLLEDINPLLGHILENWRNALPDKYVLSHQGCPTCGPRDACSPGWLWLQPDTKSWIYLKH